MANKLTRSEKNFAELCTLDKVPFNRLIERTDDRRQPDFEINLCGKSVAVEIKQIDPNEEDEEYAKELREAKFVSRTFNPDILARRIRNFIGDSRGQFTSYHRDHPQVPSLLVVMNCTEINLYSDPYTVQTAMFGWEQVELSVPADGAAPFAVERGFARRNNAEIRPDKNRHLSAVGILTEFWELESHLRCLGLSVFHNHFADVPVPSAAWRSKHVTHFRLESKVPNEFQNWQEVAGSTSTEVGDGH